MKFNFESNEILSDEIINNLFNNDNWQNIYINHNIISITDYNLDDYSPKYYYITY